MLLLFTLASCGRGPNSGGEDSAAETVGSGASSESESLDETIGETTGAQADAWCMVERETSVPGRPITRVLLGPGAPGIAVNKTGTPSGYDLYLPDGDDWGSPVDVAQGHFGDIDGDGVDDLRFLGEWWRGLGGGEFAAEGQPFDVGIASTRDYADLDADGRLDRIDMEYCSATILQGLGDGQFGEALVDDEYLCNFAGPIFDYAERGAVRFFLPGDFNPSTYAFALWDEQAAEVRWARTSDWDGAEVFGLARLGPQGEWGVAQEATVAGVATFVAAPIDYNIPGELRYPDRNLKALGDRQDETIWALEMVDGMLAPTAIVDGELLPPGEPTERTVRRGTWAQDFGGPHEEVPAHESALLVLLSAAPCDEL